ncbi:MAG: peptidyl-prolyl cis-trans isomerase [Deltaproteobacteria bacterium]|nr:peptidyl-prolyl cis-trans isomerase [Deltaproteobacteria bacterium]
MKFIKNVMTCIIILSIAFFASICFGAGKSSNPMVVIETSKGNITVELYKDKAPKTVENFLEYVNAGYYNGTIFHRVIQGFMIQGGGFTEDMVEKSELKDPIENEAANGVKNTAGTIAMARTNEIHSATSQFFINTQNNTFLNHSGTDADSFGYAVFGKVKKGMSVVYKIEGVETGNRGFHENVPTEPVIIKSVYVKTE